MIEMVPKPHIRRRTCGGYLATSPKRGRFQIGVTAKTEADACPHSSHVTVYRPHLFAGYGRPVMQVAFAPSAQSRSMPVGYCGFGAHCGSRPESCHSIFMAKPAVAVAAPPNQTR